MRGTRFGGHLAVFASHSPVFELLSSDRSEHCHATLKAIGIFACRSLRDFYSLFSVIGVGRDEVTGRRIGCSLVNVWFEKRLTSSGAWRFWMEWRVLLGLLGYGMNRYLHLSDHCCR